MVHETASVHVYACYIYIFVRVCVHVFQMNRDMKDDEHYDAIVMLRVHNFSLAAD